MNATAARDFTFKAERGGVSLEIPVHFAYAEVLVSIAGGNFEPVTPTSNNTAVVGQKIEAKIEVDPFLTVQAVDGFEWNWSVSDNAILNYLTTASEGRVIEHTFADLHNETFEFYNPYGNATSVGCDFSVSWPGSNGLVNTRGLSEGAGINFVKPAVDYFTSTIATTFLNGKGAVDVRSFEFNLANGPALQLGGVEEYVRSDGTPDIEIQTGIKWEARVTPTPYAGGDIALTQLINSEKTSITDSGVTFVRSTNGNYVLDSSPQYANVIESVTSSEPLTTNDTPGSQLLSIDKYTKREDHFLTYLMYRPDGQDSIWVSLNFMSWYWEGEAQKNSSGKWELVPNSAQSSSSRSYDTNTFPTWNTNYASTKSVVK